jgi:hypothetical protein
MKTDMQKLIDRGRSLVMQLGDDAHHTICCTLAYEFALWERDMFPIWLSTVVSAILKGDLQENY